MDKKSNIPRIVYIFSFFGSLAGMLYGYAMGCMSLVLPSMTKQFAFGPTMQGIIVSAVLLGALPALVVTTAIEKKVERRTILVIAGIIFIVSSVASSLSNTVYAFFIFRLFIGFSIGVANMYSLIYLVELAPSSIRGTVGSLYQLFVNVGIFVSYIVGAYFSTTGNWKAVMLVGALPAIVFVIGMAISPSSPRWLIRDNQLDKARNILARIRGSKDEVEHEILEVQASLKSKNVGIKEVIKSYKPVLLTVATLAFFQVFTGINAVIFYTPMVFKGLNMPNAAVVADFAVGIALVLVSIISVFLVDRLGRRFLLMTSFLFQAIPLVLIAIFPTNAVLDVICVFTYISAFSIGLGPVYGLYVPEVFPLHVRAAGSGIITFLQYFMNFILGTTFPNIFNTIGFNVFYILAVLSIAALIFVYFKIPETKGKSLEEIELFWNKKA